MLLSHQVNMINEAAEAKVRFLEASARHYASSAPETSAHLMAARHNVEANESGIVSKNKTGSSGSCKACGSILVPGWTARTSIVRKGGWSKAALEKKKRPKNASDLLKYLRVDCLLCYRYEERFLQGLKPKSKDALKTSTTQAVIGSEPQHPSSQIHDSSAASTSHVQASQPLTTNTSSKKRAKARKQGGLQAMLEKSKASDSPSSGFGLDLLDLMKPI